MMDGGGSSSSSRGHDLIGIDVEQVDTETEGEDASSNDDASFLCGTHY